jgi:glycosyltransferase involved in cell wall biosynthesis
MTPPRSLIIIPAYNEALSIASVVEDIRTNSEGHDILVINDGSADATEETARSCGVRVITLPYNLGIGGAMQTGYLYAFRNGYDVAIQFDGDGQHMADQIKALIAPLAGRQADVVIGSRFLGDKTYRSRFTRLFGIKILSAVISLLIGRRITDPTSGFRAVNREVIGYYSCSYPDDYPEPEAVVLLHRARFRIAEVPASMRERQAGSSSITALGGFYYMAKVILAIIIDMMKKISGR